MSYINIQFNRMKAKMRHEKKCMLKPFNTQFFDGIR
jgi:hypothetical protein